MKTFSINTWTRRWGHRKNFSLSNFSFSIIYVTMIYVCLRNERERRKKVQNSVYRFLFAIFFTSHCFVVVAYRRLREIYVATLECFHVFHAFPFSSHFNSFRNFPLPREFMPWERKKFYYFVSCEWKKKRSTSVENIPFTLVSWLNLILLWKIISFN